MAFGCWFCRSFTMYLYWYPYMWVSHTGETCNVQHFHFNRFPLFLQSTSCYLLKQINCELCVFNVLIMFSDKSLMHSLINALTFRTQKILWNKAIQFDEALFSELITINMRIGPSTQSFFASNAQHTNSGGSCDT